MVDRIKNMNWFIYSNIALIFANIAVIFAITQLAINTKEMQNSTLISSYIIVGLITFVVIKLNNALIKKLN